MIDAGLLAQTPQAEDRPPVGGFAGWWDAADMATYTGGGATWKSKDAAQRTVTRQAGNLQTGVTQNGRNVLWSSGVGTRYQGAPVLSGFPYTVFAVALENTGFNRRSLFMQRQATGDGSLHRIADGRIEMWAAGGMQDGQWGRNVPRVVTMEFEQGAGAAQLRLEGGRTVVTGTVGTTAPDAVSWSLFAAPTNVDHWSGWVAELLFYQSVLTASQIQRTEAYLMRKWGLA